MSLLRCQQMFLFFWKYLNRELSLNNYSIKGGVQNGSRHSWQAVKRNTKAHPLIITFHSLISRNFNWWSFRRAALQLDCDLTVTAQKDTKKSELVIYAYVSFLFLFYFGCLLRYIQPADWRVSMQSRHLYSARVCVLMCPCMCVNVLASVQGSQARALTFTLHHLRAGVPSRGHLHIFERQIEKKEKGGGRGNGGRVCRGKRGGKMR